MQWFYEVAIMVALFLLRLGVPIAAIFCVSCALRRLDAHWQAAALARRYQPASALAPAAHAAAPALSRTSRVIQEPCWEYKACPQDVRAKCPAFLNRQVPCWLAQRAATGRLPHTCCNCSIFATAPRGVTAAS